MAKTHLGDGVFAERLADGTIQLTFTTFGIGPHWHNQNLDLTPATIVALAQFCE